VEEAKMVVLGSTYIPMMEEITRRAGPGVEIRAFDPLRPLAEQIGGAEVLILGHQRVTAEILAAAPDLRLIQQHGRGVDVVDLEAARHSGVVVANVPGGNSVAVAEHTLALLLHVAKGMHKARKSLSARLTGQPMGMELRGKTLGIVGLGAAGAELARIARALGMRVAAIRADAGKGAGVPLDFLGGQDQLGKILTESDIVVLLATLTPRTDGMMGPDQLALMKSSAFLINTGRARLVVRQALHEALASKRIAGAAFDVFWDEPADPGDPLLALENFVLTPHVAGFSDTAVADIAEAVVDNIRRFAAGGPLVNVIPG
jgi:D-3-phosphoglycerate dehydrogenase